MHGMVYKSILNINNHGKFIGSCEDTGIQNSIEPYNRRSTKYCKSGEPGGPGFIMNAIIYYQKYQVSCK